MNEIDTENGGTHERNRATGQYRANPTDTAWLAGVLDGEGSIYAQVMPPGRNTRCDIGGMRINVKIGNTSMLLMQKAARIIEAITYRKHRIAMNQSSTVHGRLMYCVEVSSSKAIEALLEATLPYLTVKKAQAEAMLAYCESRKSTRHHGRGYTSAELGLPGTLKRLKLEVFDYMPGSVQTKRVAPTPTLVGSEGEAIVGARRNVG